MESLGVIDFLESGRQSFGRITHVADRLRRVIGRTRECIEGDQEATDDGRFRIALVNPRVPSYHHLAYNPATATQGSLAALKMCTPRDVTVTVVDENEGLLDLEQLAENDLVGISAATAMAPRAYEIADQLQRLRSGIQMVLGGIHPTVLPEEAFEHCDAVVQGEAEGVWPALLKDAQRGRLKELYDGRVCRPETWEIPPAPPSRYRSLHVSRGCPHPCEFCCTPSMTGQQQRRLPVEQVVESIKRDPLLWPHVLAFFDDNLLANQKWACELAEGLAPLNVRWASMSSIDTADDEDFLKFLYESGYRASLVGFESTNPENLRSVRKRVNTIRDYGEALERMHRAGISVIGAFILGLDHDTPESIRDMVDTLTDIKLDMATFSILTPFPGTPLFDRMEEEGRILHRDWSRYTAGQVVFQPQQMSPRELQEIYERTRRQFFAPGNILRRTGAIRNKLLTLAINTAAHLSFREKGPVVNRRPEVST